MQELISLSQPQRVELHGGSMQPPAHSPKPGRVPLPHEPLPSAHAGQPRSIAHRPGYETPAVSVACFAIYLFCVTAMCCNLFRFYVVWVCECV